MIRDMVWTSKGKSTNQQHELDFYQKTLLDQAFHPKFFQIYIIIKPLFPIHRACLFWLSAFHSHSRSLIIPFIVVAKHCAIFVELHKLSKRTTVLIRAEQCFDSNSARCLVRKSFESLSACNYHCQCY